MSNIRDLFSDRRRDENNSDDDDDDDGNNRFVGGIGDRGGGSGLAVRPNNRDRATGSTDAEGAIFRLAQNASSDDQAQVRRTITMYRNGFVVDDGPYRRLDDPDNREFLQSLAKGQTPRELVEEGGEGGVGGDVMVGLIDKRQEDYVETFQSFSGTGQSLGGGNATSHVAEDDDTVFDPATLSEASSSAGSTSSTTTTAIQVRLINGQRRVVRLDVNATVEQLASHVRDAAAAVGTSRFRLVSGFPPKPLKGNVTIAEAGLKGAQVSMQSV